MGCLGESAVGQVVSIAGKVISVCTPIHHLPTNKNSNNRGIDQAHRQLSPEFIIELLDGGQVTACATEITDEYIKPIAKVETESRVKALDCSNFGDKYDLKLAQAAVDIVHNPNLHLPGKGPNGAQTVHLPGKD
ncbi:hypothetical protein PtB15_3B53 [Puccinia triticina]|nr:hypothetical protein PtB15_3B53 [Puccinia triticina]